MAIKGINDKKWTHYAFSVLVILSIIILFIFIDDLIRAFSHITFINGFIVAFIALVIEALPFLLIGCIVSAFLEVYVSEKTITRLIPKNKLLGVIITSLLGIIFPVCECATIPIVRRLRKKGVPLYIAITFMAAAPIVNLTVILSTSFAFWDRLVMILLRIVCGFTGAITIGLVLSLLESKNMLKNVMRKEKTIKPPDHLKHDHSANHSELKDQTGVKKSFLKQLQALFTHAGTDFYDTGRYFILGAFLASLLHYIIPGAEKLKPDTWLKVDGILDITTFFDSNEGRQKTIPKILVNNIKYIDPPKIKYIFAK